MFHRILVPLDGSLYAEGALPVAATLAKASEATISLALVHEPAKPTAFGDLIVTDVPMIDAAQERQQREFEQTYIADQAEALALDTGVIATAIVLDGDVTDALAEYARAIDIDLVVMTTHGRSGLARMWLGSIADSFVRRTHTPVLLVRPHEAAPETRPAQPITKVVIPLDGSRRAEQILQHALNLGRAEQMEYTLLQIVEPLKIPGYAPLAYTTETLQHVTEGIRAEAYRYLEGIAHRLRSQGHSVSTKVVVDPLTARAILEYAHTHDVDVIAMATHGRGGLARFFLGSVADKVLRGAETLVLLDRPRDEKPPDRQAESSA